jgi:predicted dehydrogenase
VFNVALIGFGLAGRAFHAPLIQASEGLRLRTIVTSRGDEVAARYPEARVATVEEVMADGGVDLVVIATPNDTHAPLARAALTTGKAVVVDKPFTITVADAEALTDLARTQERLLSVFHNRRWDADFLAIRQLVAEDRLGPVMRFESRFDRFRPQVQDRWRERDEPGAGVWFDLGPHLIDQALQLFGPPLGITCDLQAQRRGAVAHDYAHAVLRYERLRVVLHADSVAAAHDLRFAVHGERASFLKEGMDPQESQMSAGLSPGGPGWGVDPRPGVIVDGASGARTPFAGPGGDYRRFYDGVASAMRGEDGNPVTPEEATAVMRIVEAGVRSSRARAEIPLQA